MEPAKHRRTDDGVAVIEDCAGEVWTLGDMPSDVLIHVARFLGVSDLSYYGCLARKFLPVAQWVYALRKRTPYKGDMPHELAAQSLPVPPGWVQAMSSYVRLDAATTANQLPREEATRAAAACGDEGKYCALLCQGYPPEIHACGVVAAQTGNMPFLERVRQHAREIDAPDPVCHPEVIRIAAHTGNMTLIRECLMACPSKFVWFDDGLPYHRPLRPTKSKMRRIVAHVGVETGNLELFQFAGTKFAYEHDILWGLAFNGHAHVLQWMFRLNIGIPGRPGLAGGAVKGGHSHVLELLHDEIQNSAYRQDLGSRLLLQHIRREEFDAAERMIRGRRYYASWVWSGLMCRGRIDLLEWVYGRVEFVSDALYLAVAHGKLEAIRWGVAHGMEICNYCWGCAIRSGSIALLDTMMELTREDDYARVAMALNYYLRTEYYHGDITPEARTWADAFLANHPKPSK